MSSIPKVWQIILTIPERVFDRISVTAMKADCTEQEVLVRGLNLYSTLMDDVIDNPDHIPVMFNQKTGEIISVVDLGDNTFYSDNEVN